MYGVKNILIFKIKTKKKNQVSLVKNDLINENVRKMVENKEINGNNCL